LRSRLVAAQNMLSLYQIKKVSGLLTGLGVEGDSHIGEKVKHRSRVAVDPTQPNLRQVHLIHSELHDELRAADFILFLFSNPKTQSDLNCDRFVDKC
jgi:hypothetical protein